MPRYPLCYNLICNKLQAQGHRLRRQTRSDLWWIMTTMDLDGRRIPAPLRGQVPTAKQRFREIGKQQLTRDLVVELEQLVIRGVDCLRAERRRQYRVFMERERGY